MTEYEEGVKRRIHTAKSNIHHSNQKRSLPRQYPNKTSRNISYTNNPLHNTQNPILHLFSCFFSPFLIHLKHFSATPELLNTESTSILPEIILEAEDDAVLTSLLKDTLDGSLLLRRARNGSTVGVTSAGPTALEVVSGLARALGGNEVKLTLDEATSALSGDGTVEERLDVSSDNVDNAAEGMGGLHEDVEGFGGGDGAGVSSALDSTLDGADEACEALGGSEVVEDSLVTDDNHDDQGPVVVTATPVDNVGDLALGAINTAAVDEHTNDQLNADGLSGSTDVLETRAVSGVQADGGEALGLDHRDISEDLTGTLAVACLSVRGIGHSPLLAIGDNATATRRGRRLVRRRSGLGLGWWGSRLGLSRRCRSGRRWGSWGSRRSRSLGRGRGSAGVGADVNIVSGGDGNGLLGSSVGSRSVGSQDRADEDGAGRNAGDDRSNCISTSRWADIGSGPDHAGDGAINELSSGIGDHDSCSGGHSGGYATDGVVAGVEDGGRRSNSGGGRGDGHSLCGDGVCARCRQRLNFTCGQRNCRLGHGRLDHYLHAKVVSMVGRLLGGITVWLKKIGIGRFRRRIPGED